MHVLKAVVYYLHQWGGGHVYVEAEAVNETEIGRREII